MRFSIMPGLNLKLKLDHVFFEEARAFGFDTVGIAIYPGHFSKSPEDVNELKRLCRQYGISVDSVHCDFAALDGNHQREIESIIHDDLRLTAEVGANCLVVHSSIFADPDTMIKDKEGKLYPAFSVLRDLENPASGVHERIRSGMAAYAKKAKSLGVRIALETEIKLNRVLPELVADVDTSACGICFDSGHAQIDEDAASQARLLAPRTICTHLHDNDGKNDLHLPPFQGVIDWPGVMKAFAESGYQGTYTFECLSGTMAQIVEARDRLQKV